MLELKDAFSWPAKCELVVSLKKNTIEIKILKKVLKN